MGNSNSTDRLQSNPIFEKQNDQGDLRYYLVIEQSDFAQTWQGSISLFKFLVLESKEFSTYKTHYKII